jgi:hypothetical protein
MRPGIVCGRFELDVLVGGPDRVDSLRICLVGNEWVKVWTLLKTTRCKRGPLVIWTDTSSEISVGIVKLEEVIEKPCTDILARNPKVCKSILLDQ